MKHLLRPVRGIWRKNIPIYDATVYLSVAPSILEAYQQLPNSIRKWMLSPPEDCAAGTIDSKRGEVAILLVNGPHSPKHSHITHEVGHAVGMIFDGVGIKSLWGSEEGCYLADYIAEWVYTTLNILRPIHAPKKSLHDVK